MALPDGCARRAAPLGDDEARAYLFGGAIPWAGAPGWTRVEWRGMPLGWAKASDGMLKNHLPKGLRRV